MIPFPCPGRSAGAAGVLLLAWLAGIGHIGRPPATFKRRFPGVHSRLWVILSGILKTSKGVLFVLLPHYSRLKQINIPKTTIFKSNIPKITPLLCLSGACNIPNITIFGTNKLSLFWKSRWNSRKCLRECAWMHFFAHFRWNILSKMLKKDK
jgi:hypothetical protein